jgi:hypothetical protein
MTAQNYIEILREPERLDDGHMMQLEQWIQKYPYFQSAKAMHLKGLYRQNSFRYNQALKETAIQTVDRAVLFEFITSDRFRAHKPLQIDFGDQTTENLSETKHSFEDPFIRLEKTEITTNDSISVKESALTGNTSPAAQFVENEAHDEATRVEANAENAEMHVANHISVKEEAPSGNTSPMMQTADDENDAEVKHIEARLGVGSPLQFEKTEIHSFEEWLQLTRLKPIEREKPAFSNETTIAPNSIPTSAKVVEVENKQEIENLEVKAEKLKKIDIIDKFIATNPKIIAKKDFVADIQIQSQPNDPAQLMTETLAKIYLEQKKYQRAIQAYEILILKYPEKSYLFADRIADIKKLQQNNTQ